MIPRLAPNSSTSIPAAALLAALLSLLHYDFGDGLGGLPAHELRSFLAGALLAAISSLLVAALRSLPLVALCGALLGAASGAVLAEGGVANWLGWIGTGVVVSALVQILADLAPEELTAALGSAGVFFLIITTFWITKSLKKGFFVGFYKTQAFDWGGLALSGAGAEQLAKVANMLAAIAAMTIFSWLSRRLHRARLVLLLGSVFALVFALLAGAIRQPTEARVWMLYLGGDLFNTFLVPGFFAFLNDSVRTEAARRIYALVVFGGVLGGAVGANTSRALEKSLGASNLLVIAACFAAGAGLLALLASRWLGRLRGAAPAEPPPPTSGNPALAGARLTLASRHLTAIALLMGLYEFISATLDYQWTATQVVRLADEEAIRAHTSLVYTITNWASLGVQLLLADTLLRKVGVRAALFVLPIVLVASSSGFLLFPVLLTAAALSISDNSLNYSINQSARESLWVVASRDAKYRAKAFIDMVIQRSAKALAVGLALGLDAIGPAYARWLSLPVLVVLAVWMGAARVAAREYEKLGGKSGAQG